MLGQYLLTIKRILVSLEAFDKPPALSHEDWHAALLSVISLHLTPLSDEQKQAIATLQAFMKPAYINIFQHLPYLSESNEPLSFGEIYDYLYSVIKQEIPSELQTNIVERAIDPALAKLQLGQIKDYTPSSSDYHQGFLILTLERIQNLALAHDPDLVFNNKFILDRMRYLLLGLDAIDQFMEHMQKYGDLYRAAKPETKATLRELLGDAFAQDQHLVMQRQKVHLGIRTGLTTITPAWLGSIQDVSNMKMRYFMGQFDAILKFHPSTEAKNKYTGRLI